MVVRQESAVVLEAQLQEGVEGRLEVSVLLLVVV